MAINEICMHIKSVQRPETIHDDVSEINAVRIDMMPFIRAYKAFLEYARNPAIMSKFPENHERLKNEFAQIKSEYKNELKGAHLAWGDLLAQTIELLDQETKAALLTSPVVTILNVGFLEILQNCMDEIVCKHLNSDSCSDSAEAELVLNIQYELMEDTITVELADNGPGFSPDFLAKVNTYEAREKYIKTKHERNPAKLDLFGGEGHGLSMLIAHLEHGASLDKGLNLKPKEHILPNSSVMECRNHHKGGAIISMTSTISPREKIKMAFNTVYSAAESENKEMTLSLNTQKRKDTTSEKTKENIQRANDIGYATLFLPFFKKSKGNNAEHEKNKENISFANLQIRDDERLDFKLR